MAWVRPRRSRPGQEGADAGNSGGIGGSSLPGGGPAALGGGDTGLGGDGWRGLQRINATTGLISSQASDAAEVLAIGHAGHPSPSSRQERGAIAPRKRMRDQPGLVQKNNCPSDAFKAFNFAVCCHALRPSESTAALCNAPTKLTGLSEN